MFVRPSFRTTSLRLGSPFALATLATLFGQAGTAAHASPVSYFFRGTLDQPYDGTNAFSGTFSYEAGTPGFGSGTLLSGAAGASASLNIGRQNYTFQSISMDGSV